MSRSGGVVELGLEVFLQAWLWSRISPDSTLTANLTRFAAVEDDTDAPVVVCCRLAVRLGQIPSSFNGIGVELPPGLSAGSIDGRTDGRIEGVTVEHAAPLQSGKQSHTPLEARRLHVPWPEQYGSGEHPFKGRTKTSEPFRHWEALLLLLLARRKSWIRSSRGARAVALGRSRLSPSIWITQSLLSTSPGPHVKIVFTGRKSTKGTAVLRAAFEEHRIEELLMPVPKPDRLTETLRVMFIVYTVGSAKVSVKERSGRKTR
jgi:hypothetical protein